MVELGGRLGLVAKPDLELGVGCVAGLQDLDRHRSPVELPPDEQPGEAALAEQALEVVGADRVIDEVGGCVGHVWALHSGVGPLTYCDLDN